MIQPASHVMVRLSCPELAARTALHVCTRSCQLLMAWCTAPCVCVAEHQRRTLLWTHAVLFLLVWVPLEALVTITTVGSLGLLGEWEQVLAYLL